MALLLLLAVVITTASADFPFCSSSTPCSGSGATCCMLGPAPAPAWGRCCSQQECVAHTTIAGPVYQCKQRHQQQQQQHHHNIDPLVVLKSRSKQSKAASDFDAARKQYALDLKDTIIRAAQGMVQGGAGLSGASILPAFNITIDEDVGGLEMLSPTMASATAGLFPFFAGRKRSFADRLVSTVFGAAPSAAPSPPVTPPPPLSVAYADSLVEGCGDHIHNVTEMGERIHEQALSEGVVAESGGGFGWGLQVYCGCTLIMTTGGGFGLGATMGNASSKTLSGGLGGGGGTQLFVDGKPDAGAADEPSLNVGGGGGGNLTGCAGSTDFGQRVPLSTMAAARAALVAPQVARCPAGLLSIVGGGGGGMGFTVTRSAAAGGNITAYGGGLDLRFANEDAAANNKICNGTLFDDGGGGDGGGRGNYGKIGKATAKCRKECKAARTKSGDLAPFWACTCPCTQRAFQALNLSFASNMKCM